VNTVFNPPHVEALKIMDAVNHMSVTLKSEQDKSHSLAKALAALLNDPNAGQLAFSACEEARTALALWNTRPPSIFNRRTIVEAPPHG
jgi:hypothetical protein